MSDGDDDGHDYEVGYGKPPVEHRFQPGQSGNPKGRPKRPRPTLDALLEKVLRDPVTVRLNGRTQTVSREEALLLKQIEQAMQGEQRVAQAILKQAEQCGLLRAADADHPEAGFLVVPDEVSLDEWIRQYGAVLSDGSRVPAVDGPAADSDQTAGDE